MTLYELLHKVSGKLSEKHADAIFDYFIHAMDDNGGFLRTRWCYWEKELEDRKVSDDIKTVLLVLSAPFDFDAATTFYEKGMGIWEKDKLTILKMQLYYEDMSEEEKLQSELEWCKQAGYEYPILVDL